MQASCKQNINNTFQILRSINFVRVVHQIDGVLYNHPITKLGGSSWSTVVMILVSLRVSAMFLATKVSFSVTRKETKTKKKTPSF